MEPETTPSETMQITPPETTSEPEYAQQSAPEREPSEAISRAQLGTAATALALLLVLVTAVELTSGSSRASLAAAVEAQEEAALRSAFEGIHLQAKSAYVANLSTGEVLYELHPDVQLPLASITKVALALAVVEVLPLESRITVSKDTAPPGSMERLAAGEVWTVKNILDFTLIASSNGGAQILADAAEESLRAKYPEATPGSAALWRMNNLAQALGLSATYFLNVHGLDESETQAGAYGSARDIAKLFAYAVQTAPSVFENTSRADIRLSEQNASTAAINTNEALPEIPGVVMGKTGFTDLAGGNLAVLFEAGLSERIVVVVLGSTRQGRFSDVQTLVDATLKAISASAEGVQ